MKYLSLLILILIFSCEGIIDANDIKENDTSTTKDFSYIVNLIENLNTSTGDALNELTYISAISTDEAIETSSETAHNLLAAQKFDQYNSNVIRVYEKFQKLAQDAKNTQDEISSIMAPLFALASDDSTSTPEDEATIAFNESINSTTITKWQDVDTLYRAYARFFEGYAIYKLASNWDDNTRLDYLPDSTEFTTFTLFRYGLDVLDSAYTLVEDLPFTSDASELKTLQATINYYRAYYNINKYVHSTDSIAKLEYIVDAARNANWEDVGNLAADDYNVKVNNSIIHQYSNNISARLIFSSVFFEDDKRLNIIEPESYRLQGSVTKNDSLYTIAFDYAKDGFLQNKYPSNNANIAIFHGEDNASLLHAEILYFLLQEGRPNFLELDPDRVSSGISVFPNDIVDKINNGRGFHTKRTDLTYELDNLPFDTSQSEEVLTNLALQYLLSEYLAADFLEGTRFETLRRLGQRPFKDGASTNYVFPSTY